MTSATPTSSPTTAAEKIASQHAAGAPLSVGRQLAASPAVRTAVDAIVSEVRAKSAMITDVRGPVPELAKSYEELMARASAVRGRGLLYPYISSGAGNGALVELLDGSVKWDMICGIGVHFFGHAEPDLIRAAVEAGIEDTLKHGNLQTSNGAFEFAETLLTEAKKHSRLKHCFVTTSGAMANENAIKVCYQKHAPGATRVLAFQDCFMGRTVTMSQLGDSAAGRVGIPLSTQVDYMPFYNPVLADQMGQTRFIDMSLEHLRQYIERYPGQHACFIFELVQGEGGFNTAPRDFHKALMEMCKAHNIAVWDDEIQSFGRTPRMFAYEQLDLGDYVDVLCVGKMTQACATLYTEQYNPKPGLLSGTFTGAAADFRVGTRVVEKLRDGAYYGPDGLIEKHHAEFRKQMHAMIARHPEWFPANPKVKDQVSGCGGMMRFTPFGGDKDKVIKACRACFDEHVILFYCGHGPYHVRMLPPLGVMKLEDWPRVIACLEKGLAKAAAS